MNVRHLHARLVAGLLAVASTPALAGMGTIASSYGLLPGDVASAQGLSLFNPEVAAVHYNPASLVADPRGELTVGLGYVDHQVEAESLGGSAPVQRQGELLDIDESRSTLLGLKTNLSSLTRIEHPLYFGLMLGVEKYGREMLAFNSGTSTGGQSFRYGKQPLFLAAGGGMQLVPGIDGGLAFRITLQSSARLTGQTDLAGNSRYEQLDVVAEPKMTPVVGLAIDWARLACGGDCAAGHWRTALAWRAASTAETRVNANVVIPGTVPPPGLDIALATLDSYHPETATLGLQYQGERLRVALTGEWQRWSALGEEFRDDTVRNQANLRFRDIVIPRLGAEWRVGEAWRLTTGIAYEESALESDRSLDVNYLDNDRYLLGLGASVEVRDPPVLAFPVRLDLGYQLQWLQERRFLLTSTQSGGTAPYETVQTRGQVHVLVGSLTMKF